MHNQETNKREDLSYKLDCSRIYCREYIRDTIFQDRYPSQNRHQAQYNDSCRFHLVQNLLYDREDLNEYVRMNHPQKELGFHC